MDESSEHQRLAVQEHPAGRVELTANVPFLQQYRQRWTNGGDISERFHENTKFDDQYLRRLTLTNDVLPESISVVTQDYHGLPSVELPDATAMDASLESVLAERRSTRKFGNDGVSRADLGTLLGHAVGPTDEVETEGLTELFRPYPSAGGTVPVEVYPVVTNGEDIEQGVYYYSPRSHSLRVLEAGEEAVSEFPNTFMEGESARDIVSDGAVTFVLTGSFGRTKAKYGPVGYRFALFEAGHIAQNLLLVAEALNMGGIPVGGFLDSDLDDFLELDGVNESALYPIVIGHQSPT